MSRPFSLFVLVFVLTSLVGAGFVYWSGRSSTVERQPAPETREALPETEEREEASLALQLFFGSSDGSALVPEKREIGAPEDLTGGCLSLIGELKAGPRGRLLPLVPEELEVKSIFLAEDVLVLDLKPRVLGLAAGALQEKLLWYSLVDSILMSFPKVAAVQFLVDGREVETVMGHMDMRGPFDERLDLVNWGS